MGAKKDRSLSTRKEGAVGRRPWPNLPQQLLNLPNLLRQIHYPGPTKSWRTSTTRRCNSSSSREPLWPQLYDLAGDSDNWNSLSKTTLPGYYIPPWDVSIPFKFVTVSSSFDRNWNAMVVALTGVSSPAIMTFKRGPEDHMWLKHKSGWAITYPTYKRGQEKYKHWWTRHEWAITDPFGDKKQSMQFTNIIGFEGKFYALSLQGTLVVMEEVNSRLEIMTIGTSRAVPSVSNWRYFKEYLIESQGELLLVFLISQKLLGVVDKVEVFRLCFPKLNWVKVESLEGRALFMEKECCIWVHSSEVGCKGNCVYFNQSKGDGSWCIYDMGSGCISEDIIDLQFAMCLS